MITSDVSGEKIDNNHMTDTKSNSKNKPKNNHYVQEALIRNFSYKETETPKVRIFSTSNNKGGWINTRSIFKGQDIYSLEVEDLFRKKIETDAASIFRKIKCSKDTVDLTRDEISLLKKYTLLQDIRTPVSLRKLSELKTNKGTKKRYQILMDGQGINESDKYFWIKIMRFVLESDWNRILHSDFNIVSHLAHTYDRLFPMVIKTSDELILPDTGVYAESSNFTRPSIDTQKVLRDICGKDFKGHELEDLTTGLDKFMNFIILPFDKNHAILFVDDIWRLYYYRQPMFDVGIRSRFMNRYILPPIASYKNPKDIYYPLEPIDSFRQYLSPDDKFTILLQEVISKDVAYLNGIAIDSSEQFFAFNDKNDVLKSIKEYNIRYEEGHARYNVSYFEKCDFSVRYPERIDQNST